MDTNVREYIHKALINIATANDAYWNDKMHDQETQLHLAIMVEPYLSRIFNGQKTIESRFSKNRISPFMRVHKGDMIILKESGGSICGIFEAGNVDYIKIRDEEEISTIRVKYEDKLKVDKLFWEQKADSRYVTLIEIKHIINIVPEAIKWKNRQSWIYLGQLYEYLSKEMD